MTCLNCGKQITGVFDGVDHPQVHDECAMRLRAIPGSVMVYGPPPISPIRAFLKEFARMVLNV